MKIHFSDECYVYHLSAFFWISDYVSEMVTRSVSQNIHGEEVPSWVKERAMERQAGLGAQFF